MGYSSQCHLASFIFLQIFISAAFTQTLVFVQIGVNNMFLLVNSMKSQDLSLPLEKRVGLALAEVGPSITLASLTEFVVFSMGVFSSAPTCQVLSGFLGKSRAWLSSCYLTDSWIDSNFI